MSNTASVARPTTVTAAFWVFVISSLLGIIGSIILLITGADGAAMQEMEESLRAGATTALIVVGVMMIIGAALRILFAWFMYKGHNWARIVLTIFGVLGVIAVISQGGAVGVLDWISVAVTVVAIVLMFLPASNAYFAESKRARQSR